MKALGPGADLVVDRLTGRHGLDKRAEDPLAREALARELTLLTETHHPAFRQAVTSDGLSPPRHITLAFVEGDDLLSAAESDPKKTQAILADVLSGLQHLHDRGLVHGDLKPSHVVVDRAGRGRLIDLGLVLPIGAPIRGGTPRYMPPEYLAGGEASVAGDLYAFGRAAEEMKLTMNAATADLLRACRSTDTSARPASALACISALGERRRKLDVMGTFPRIGGEDRLRASHAAIVRGRGECHFIEAEVGDGGSRFVDDLARACVRSGHAILAVDPAREPDWLARVADATDHALIGDEPRDVAVVVTRLARAGVALVFASYDPTAAAMVKVAAAATSTAKRGALVVLGPFGAIAKALEKTSSNLPRATAAQTKEILALAGARVDAAEASQVRDRTAGKVACIARIARRMAAGAGLEEAIDAAEHSETVRDEVPLPSSPIEVARSLETVGRVGEAMSLLSRAFPTLLAEATSEPEAVRLLARLLYRRGDLEGCSRAVRALGAKASPADEILAARCLERLGSYRAANDGALALTEARDAAVAIEAYAIAAHTSLALGAPEAASSQAEAGLRRTEAHRAVAPTDNTLEPLVGRLHTVRSDAALRSGRTEDALRFAGDALAHAEARSDDSLVAHAQARLGAAFALGGRPEDAMDHYAKALAAADRAGDVAGLPAFIANLATAEHATGRLSSAIEHYQEAASLALRFGRKANWLGAATNLAGLLIFAGADVEAKHLIEEARSVAQDTGASFYTAQLALLEAERVGRSDGERGVALARDAEEAFARIGAARQVLESTLLAHELDAGRHPEHALSFVEARLVELREAGLDGRASLLEANAQRVRGDAEAARRSARTAEAAARSSGDRELEARAVFTQGLAAESIAVGTGLEFFERARRLLDEVASTLPRGLRERFDAVKEHATIRAAGVVREAASPDRALTPQSRQLLNLVRRVLREGQESRVLEAAIDEAVALSGAERAFLVLVKPSGPAEVVLARNLDRETLRRPKFRYSRSVANKVIQSGESVVTASASDDPDFDTSRSVLDLGLRSILCVPIRGPSATLGAIYLDHRFERDRFAGEKPELVTAVADIVGLALENARLFAKSEERARELEQENEVIALESARRAAEVERLAAALVSGSETHTPTGGILGRSVKLRRALDIAKRVAPSDLPVLVTGETGTGKELFARYIHDTSLRSGKPFVAINCGAVPETLLESELFGHKRGAFTGATRDHPGLFREADRGTLLLDEIGEMPLRMQTRLLRVLQEGEVRPVGGDANVVVNVRIIAATHRNLEEAVRERTFREDLYYRLMGVSVTLPPLRERKEDIPEIASTILARLAATYERKFVLSRAALEALLRHDWPGNVRELEQAMTRGAMLSPGDTLEPDLFQLRASVGSRKSHIQHSDRELIERALASTQGNRTAAATALGVSRVTLHRWLKRYGLG